MKRATALFLILTAIIAFAACSKEEDAKQSSQNVGESTEAVTEDKYLDDLPDIMDLNGYEYRFTSFELLNLSSDYGRYLFPETINGESVNDAAWTRNSEVAERLNVKLTFIGTSDAMTSNILYNAVMAGDNAYDVGLIFSGAADDMIKLIRENCLINLLDMPNMNTSAEYYYTTMTDMLTINGKLYGTSSYFVKPGLIPLQIVFNKNMIDELGVESPYTAVFDGSWTFDAFLDYIKIAYADLNGNGIDDYGDRLGYYNSPILTQYMISGFNINTVVRDENGSYQPLLSGEKLINSIERFIDFKTNYNGVRENYYSDANHSFMDGNALFSTTGTRMLNLRSIESFDFGITPYPKYDDEQEYYCSYADLDVFCIPVTITENEAVGAVTEALAAASLKYMESVYTDLYVEQKLLRDDESIEILHIMQQRPFVEFTRYCDFSGGVIRNYNYLTSITSSGAIASSLASIE